MSKGFQKSNEETTIAIIKKRLQPSIDREDDYAFQCGVNKMIERYGMELAEKAFTELLRSSTWLTERTLNKLDSGTRGEFNAQASDVIANLLEEAGLKLEENLRATDQGLALSNKAVAVVEATGFPHCEQFYGNESLEEVGLRRNPFIHPLTETFQHDGEDCINSWGLASMLISATLNWLDEPPDNPETPRSFIAACVSRIAPTLDLDKMFYRCRYDDRALMKLASYIESGINALAQTNSEGNR